jgi:branched-chain amino acid transport system permease protein
MALVTGLMLAIETTVHYTVNPGEDPHIRAFGIPFNAASPLTWTAALVLIIGGFALARLAWARTAHVWDETLTAARAKVHHE